MKKTVIIVLAAVTIFSCIRREEILSDSLNVTYIPYDGLIDVTFTAESGSSDSKVWTGWDGSTNCMIWDQADTIGLFAGSGNVNRRFVSTSDGSASSTFSGLMAPVSTATTLIVYYPYSSGASLTSIPYPPMTDQIFEGTFEEKGEFKTFGKYALLAGGLNNFYITTTWPKGANIQFSPLVGIVRYGISSTLTESIRVRKIGMSSANNRFTSLSFIDMSTGNSSGYYSSQIRTTISDKNPLILATSETKYVQMTATFSMFQSNDEINVFVDCINDDGRNLRYIIPKTVNSDHNITVGKRTSVSVPITSSTSVVYAPRIKVTSTSESLVAPVFRHDSGYDAADAWWGDSTVEKYEAGREHTFSTSGTHTASFNHWGTSNSVTFDNLKGITAIDFSDVF